MKIAILTIFPDMLSGVLGASILGRARAQGLLTVEAVDIRPYSGMKHKNTDDYPFGGGAGMVMTAQPIVDCVQATRARGFTGPCLYLSPRGKPLTQHKVQQLAALDGFLLLCGHYEGVDQRAIDMAVDEEISLGDFVLTGGELAALAVADAVARLVPGVLGSSESAGDESFSAGLLEYPQYTRPRVYREQAVPDVLLGGDHAKINAWRRRQALLTTLQRRPDLFATAPMTHRERAETIEADRQQAEAAMGGDSSGAETRRADAAALAHPVEPSADLPEASAAAETPKKAKKRIEAKAGAQTRPASKAASAAKPSKAGKKATVAKSSAEATSQGTAADKPAKASMDAKVHTTTNTAAMPATKAAGADKPSKAGKKATVAQSSVKATAQASAADMPAKASKAATKHAIAKAEAQVEASPTTKAARPDKPAKAGKKAAEAKASEKATAKATAADMPAKAVKATKSVRKHIEATAAAAAMPATKAASPDKPAKAGKKAGGAKSSAKAKAKTTAENKPIKAAKPSKAAK